MFHSRDPLYKDPVGASPEGVPVHFRITLPRELSASAAQLVMEQEGVGTQRLDLFWCGMNGEDKEWWECHYTPSAPGLYFYYFEARTCRGSLRLARGFSGEAVSGGTEEEDDESLRTRIMELDAAKSVSFVGSVADYKRWSKEVAGVGEATVIPAQDDSGLVTVVITDSNGDPANTSLCNAVYDHIMSPGNPELRFTPPNARLLVTPPETIALSISAAVTIAQDSSMEAVLDSFLAQAQAYLATARADGEIRYTQIGKILAGTKGVYDYSGLALNGDVSNIDITKTQLPQISRESVTLTQGVTVF